MLRIDTRDNTPTKDRVIKIVKARLYDEVDAHTHKYTTAEQSPILTANAVASDNNESLDGALIAQFAEYRDAKLRYILKGVLKAEEITEVTDAVLYDEEQYIYNLAVPVDYPDTNLRPLAVLIHKYLVWGTLYDWYNQVGSAEARVYGSQLDDLQSEIQSMLFSADYTKRPAQPFGPAKRLF